MTTPFHPTSGTVECVRKAAQLRSARLFADARPAKGAWASDAFNPAMRAVEALPPPAIARPIVEVLLCR